MVKRGSYLFVCLMALLSNRAARAIEPSPERVAADAANDDAAGTWERVGDWGDVSRIFVEGAKTFPVGQFRRTISFDPDCVIAAQRDGLLRDYLSVLVDRVRVGYMRQGYARSKIGARLDRPRLQVVLSIDEGRRFVCGDTNVHGASAINVQRLVDWLKTGHPAAGARLVDFDFVDDQIELHWLTQGGAVAEPEVPDWNQASPHASTTSRCES